MAESLLFGLAESFIVKLASSAVKQASLALGVYQDLQEIRDTISFIKAVLLDAEKKQHQNQELREWMRQIKRIFSKAEDIIDDFECEALQKQVVNTSGSRRKKVRRFLSSSNPIVYRLKIAHRIQHIKESLNKVAEIRDKFGLHIKESDDRVVQRRETHSHVNDSDVIGREQDKQKIVELLFDDSDDKNLSVVAIVGLGGMGKTTLAKVVFNDKSVVDSFPLKMWICVSDDFDVKNLLVKIIGSAPDQNHQENIKNFSLEQLKNRLRDILAGQKFLLVLDDVWNEDRVKWEEFRGLIPAGAQGSKVLVTSRSDTVANMMGTYTSYNLQGLSKEDSLSVFVKWAFKEGEESKHPELMEIGKDIVLKCGGLPLALRTLGSSLFLKVDIQEWKFVRDNEIWNLPQKDEDILPAIKLSYDQLPSYLKQCFACFSLFEKDFHFNSFHTIVLWEALGFLQSPNKGDTLKDIGNKFLKELRSRSFLQDFIDYGYACKFKLHDLVHDLALYVSRDEFQLLNSHSDNISENALHLSFTKNYLFGKTPLPRGLRTILFPVGVNNEAFLNTLVSRCTCLRVLQINNSGYESLPSSIGKLKHLRYLNLEDNEKLKSVPDSVCKLQNLINLDLSGCIKLQELPNGIGNLISLQQLHITTLQSKFPDNEIAKLTFLEILTLVDCDNLESLFEGIEELPSLKFLDIYSCKSLRSVPLHVIPNLESLSIGNCYRLNLSMGHDNQIAKLRLKLLALESLPQLLAFPEWLQGSVNTLQSLVIVDCDHLKDLPEWLSTMIYLKTLSIQDCPTLLSLPDGVHHLRNLEYLKIKGCPELCRRYETKVGQDWPKISHIKQVIIESPELED
ncbi:putative disease resistance protein RGA3 [Medicago truncatula]|uniref:Disease resistance protein (CC-NBS-LRR class) family protein n=2 Tax=Medicago truncatula TaxID=3880 RepID=A0A072VMC6_MEDTR|nr:putative disease resistance protein RGA3 [Medicago truncatula]KEH42967.1 disease resistance protein (CC-NBS-LRR class) family protein [Medicago truncatula]